MKREILVILQMELTREMETILMGVQYLSIIFLVRIIFLKDFTRLIGIG